jgi:AcrR family transcriptional regulator
MKTQHQPLRVKLREATWNAILEAAEEVAAREGAASASLQAIAERAGIAVGTISNYFDDKVVLFDALFTRRREELYGAIDEAAKKHAKDPFAAQLESFVGNVFSFFDARRAFLRIALELESHGPQIVKTKGGGKQPAMQQLLERAERVVRIGVREKQLRDDGADLLATVLVSIVRGVLVMRAGSEKPFAAETAHVVSLFLNGAGK